MEIYVIIYEQMNICYRKRRSMDENEYYANKWSYYSNMLLWGILFKNAISEKKGNKDKSDGKRQKRLCYAFGGKSIGCVDGTYCFF